MQQKEQELNAQLAQKANLTYVDSKVASLKDASIKGTYPTLSALQLAHPSGNSNIYVVTSSGDWYYWNGSVWASGGQFVPNGTIINPLTNIAPNGDFSNSNTGWSIDVASLVAVENNELTFIATGQYGRTQTVW